MARGRRRRRCVSPNQRFLHLVSQGNLLLIEKFLDNPPEGFDINATDAKGNTAVILAVEGKRLDILKALLKVPGVQVDKQNQAGQWALMLAAEQDYTWYVEALLDSGADPHKLDSKGYDPFITSVRKGYYQTLEKFMECEKLDVNHPYHKGLRAIHYSVLPKKGSRYRIIDILVADPKMKMDAKSDDGRTAFAIALQHKKQSFAEHLLFHGASPLLVDPRLYKRCGLEVFHHDFIPFAIDAAGKVVSGMDLYRALDSSTFYEAAFTFEELKGSFKEYGVREDTVKLALEMVRNNRRRLCQHIINQTEASKFSRSEIEKVLDYVVASTRGRKEYNTLLQQFAIGLSRVIGSDVSLIFNELYNAEKYLLDLKSKVADQHIKLRIIKRPEDPEIQELDPTVCMNFFLYCRFLQMVDPLREKIQKETSSDPMKALFYADSWEIQKWGLGYDPEFKYEGMYLQEYVSSFLRSIEDKLDALAMSSLFVRDIDEEKDIEEERKFLLEAQNKKGVIEKNLIAVQSLYLMHLLQYGLVDLFLEQICDLRCDLTKSYTPSGQTILSEAQKLGDPRVNTICLMKLLADGNKHFIITTQAPKMPVDFEYQDVEGKTLDHYLAMHPLSAQEAYRSKLVDYKALSEALVPGMVALTV